MPSEVTVPVVVERFDRGFRLADWLAKHRPLARLAWYVPLMRYRIGNRRWRYVTMHTYEPRCVE